MSVNLFNSSVVRDSMSVSLFNSSGSNSSLLDSSSLFDSGSGVTPGCATVCSVCEVCSQRDICEPRSCLDTDIDRRCCPVVNSITVACVGAALLCLLILLLVVAVCHWRDGCRPRVRLPTEALLDAEHGAVHRRGPENSVDSVIACIVCMDHAIGCVLMPCAHEVACLRCAQRLGLCPVCRTPVSATLRTRSAADGLPGTPLGTPARQLPPVAEDETAADGAPAAAAPDSRFKGMGCLRCAERPANCVFLPCSHKVWCTECSEQQQQATCPICSTGITQTLKTFHKRL